MRGAVRYVRTRSSPSSSIAWGSQIRSYTLQPFQLVKDHRSGCEIGNVQAVLDGSIDELIIAYLRFLKSDKKQ